MDTKWKKSKSVLGFLAFLLGVSMVLEGGLYFGTKLTYSGSRRWISDSFASDWRDTSEFQGFTSQRLERLIIMGAGGRAYRVYGSDYGYGDTLPNYAQINEARNKAVHNSMKEDKNVL